jgi:hypothetical protein
MKLILNGVDRSLLSIALNFFRLLIPDFLRLFLVVMPNLIA